MALPATNRHLLIFLLLRSMNKQLNFPTIFWSFAVPRGVLKDDFDFSLELDEEHQVEPPFIIEMDEDEAQYKEAVPPAPKLQGTIPRSDGTNATTNGTQSATGDGSSATSVLIQGENSFTDGELIFSVFAFFFCATRQQTRADVVSVWRCTIVIVAIQRGAKRMSKFCVWCFHCAVCTVWNGQSIWNGTMEEL